MPKTRELIAEKLTGELAAFEAALAQTMERGSMLVASLSRAQMDGRVSLSVGNGAIGYFVGALAELHSARVQTVDGHVALNSVRKNLGLKERAIGDKEDDGGSNPIGGHLRVAA